MRVTPAGLALVVVLAGCGASSEQSGSARTAEAVSSPVPRAEATPVTPLGLSTEHVAAVLQRLSGEGDAGARTRTPQERAWLSALYATVPTALWLSADGRPTPDAEDALALLATADAHGLLPSDYQATALARYARDRDPEEAAPADLARVRFDLRLSLHVLRYWRDLHLGRVDPLALGFRLSAPVDDHDFPAMLRQALAGHRLGAATSELVPPLVLYRSLVTALGRYRDIARHASPVSLPTPTRSFKPGDQVEGLDSLRTLLVHLGDMPHETPAAGDIYEGPLVDGVRRFQTRHGLEADGALGRATVAALRIPPGARVQQLELALERLRWLPHLDEDGFLAVNIPMFRLWGWGRIPPDGAPAFDMGVIVGRALDTRTPVFIAEMSHLIFRPYWNVPTSILRGEILPALSKAPTYLARNDMEIVAGPGDDARAVPLSDASLEDLRQGRLRVRQRPGPKNALGLVKFVFPNDDDIYMHGTPAVQLFGRARRDFSHGCVRVQDPVGLTAWLLRDQPGWSRERILAAMEGPVSQRVTLTRPVQVVLFYLTAVVLPADGAVHFAEDIYGHDARLARALARSTTI